MCYNCGCGRPDDPMGHPGVNITSDMIQKAAQAMDQTPKEAMQEMAKLLQSELKKLDQDKK